MISGYIKGKEIDVDCKDTIVSEFERQVKRTPYKTAVINGEYEFCYSEINEKANQFADWLIKRGVQNEDLIVLSFERSYKMLVCIMGIWKAGVAYIPLDNEFPEERKNKILLDSNPFLVIHDGTFVESFEGSSIAIDVLWEDLNKYKKCNKYNKAESSNLAYIIYTSGSTGMPKGAMVEHRGMLNHMKSKVENLNINEDSIIAQNASHSFDISVWQFFCALLVGGTTVIYSNNVILDKEEFISQIAADYVTILEVVPSYLSVILEDDFDDRLENLEFIVVTGERLPNNLVQKWFDCYSGIPMVNAYGPTEASDDITHYIMNERPENEIIYVGTPIRNMSIYIVDENMNLCKDQEIGEICVAGIGVGRGYLNDLDKTLAVFMDSPFESEKRMYKTGDYGRLTKDGLIEFMGRRDEQVKINGHRIELGEVRSYVLQHTKIKDAVIVVNSKNDNPNLVAFVIASEKISSEEIIEKAKNYGPAYMVPTIYYFVDEYPLTDNGKIDIKKLKLLIKD